MVVELKVPEVGESITEVEIASWFMKEGDTVQLDEPVVELETAKVTVPLPSPATGVLSKMLKKPGEAANVGEVIGYIEERGEASAKAETGEAPKKRPEPEAEPEPSPKPSAAATASAGPDRSDDRGIERRTEKATPPQDAGPAQPLALREAEVEKAQQQSAVDGREEELVNMSPLRRMVADRLIQAQQTAALLTTFNEIDMSAIMSLRKRYRDTFQERYGVKLGFMSFFIKATVEALKSHPAINAEIRDRSIVYRNYYDIGIAVDTPKGLAVPFIRNAERMGFADIERTMVDLATRARENQLKLKELEGGTFTITNGGVFGSLLSTPIINPPQSGILGLHAIQDRPVARDGQVVIRPMMYTALTYDHRIVDGRGAVTFLRRIKELLEDPAVMLLEV
ncbi:MAG: 2-oxoglutarate dehydrogenase complex dihydrolipoyllysine-residue succinyltransferase [Phycisphaeraceae bacterium]